MPRAVLQQVTRAYVAAQEAGDASQLTALVSPHPNQIYLENNGLADPAGGALAEPLRIDFSRSIHDPDRCAAFTEIIGASDPHPRASLIESVVTDEGDWLFNATGTLELNAGEVWDEILPEEEEEERAATPAERGGAVGGRAVLPARGGAWRRGARWVRDGECVMAFPSRIVVPYRRYVVDVTLGAASLLIGLPGLDRTQGDAPMPDSHLFRVEHGKIKYIHTASACVVEGCDLNATSLSWRRRRRRSLKKPVSFRG
ncbi:hypothetical protein L209DRAFT_778035 [Thermothelomyces heterothallicus CBS 203.75]